MSDDEPVVDLSIVVACTRPERVKHLFSGLSLQCEGYVVEVFVVGDIVDPAPEARGFRAEWIPCADRHANIRRNLGLARARGVRVAFIDDDAVPEPGWLKAAMSVAPDAAIIATGPEIPVRETRGARLAFAVNCNFWSEGSSAHTSRKPGPVAWSDVPFCNCVMPRAVVHRVGMLAIDIPWDMDDFEFCLRAKPHVRFERIPELLVRHDRYPDTARAFLAYKWRLRVRTGEKLVSHPSIYARLPALVAVAVGPWLVMPWVVAVGAMPTAALAFVLMWLLLLASQLPRAFKSVPTNDVPRYLALVGALQVIAAVAVQLGVIRGLVHRATGQR